MIDAYKVAQEAGMGNRINTIMQTCFFAISGVLPRDEAIEQIKKAIRKTLRQARRVGRAARTSPRWMRRSQHLYEVAVPATVGQRRSSFRPPVPDAAPALRAERDGAMMAGDGDLLPVSAVAR